MIAYWTVASHLQPAALRARRRAVREERTRHARVGRMGRGDEKKGPLGALPGLTWDPAKERYFAATAAAPAPPTEPTTPISSEAVAAWPAAARVVETLPAAAPGGDACPVCLEALSSKVVALPCGHRLHRRCAAPWLGRRGSCPACRRGVDRALEVAARAAAPA